MGCRHENADHPMPGESFAPYTTKPRPYVIVSFEQFRCLDCGHWLPLGPANNGGEFAESVVVEKRAAKIAAGRFVHPIDTDGHGPAGYLARVIATHAED